MLALNKIGRGPDGIKVMEKDIPHAEKNHVVIQVYASGVCGTDMQIYRDAGTFAKRVALPRTLGHETCGTVIEVGEDVTGIEAGDVVSLESHIPCRVCKTCTSGHQHVCPHTRYPGIDIDGTFAEYVKVPASIVWKNPADVDKKTASLLEPLGIAVHATLEGQGVAGRTVVVNGCGPIGLMNIAVARAFGASRIIAVETNPLRQKTAIAMGADDVIDPFTCDAPALVRDITRGEGADCVFEYTGNPKGVLNCFSMVAPMGDVKWCATPTESFEFDFGLWRKGRPSIYNIHGRKIWDTWHAMAPLVYPKRLDISPVISHEIELKDAVRAFELITAGEAIKPIILS